MPTSSISNVVKDPTGAVLSGVPVDIWLSLSGSVQGGFRISDGSEVVPYYSTTTNGSGVWSAALERNTNISPLGTYYIAVERLSGAQGKPRHWSFVVGASNQTLKQALITQPPDGTPPTTLTAQILAGNNEFIGTNDFQGDVHFAGGTPVFDVKSPLFGGVGNGIANDTAAITAAIAAAHAAGGGIVYFPKGSYYVPVAGSSGILIPNNVILLGQGRGLSVIVTEATATAAGNLFQFAPATSFSAQWMGFSGPSDAAGFSVQGFVQNANGNTGAIRFRDCNFDNSLSICIHASSTTAGSTCDILAERCLVNLNGANPYAGEFIVAAMGQPGDNLLNSFVTARDCDLYAFGQPACNQGHGFYIYDSVSLLIESTRFYTMRGTGSCAIHYNSAGLSKPHYSIISNCLFSSGTYSGTLNRGTAGFRSQHYNNTYESTNVHVDAGGDIEIVGGVSRGNPGAGSFVVGLDGPCKFFRISGHKFETTSNPIWTYGTNTIILVDNCNLTGQTAAATLVNVAAGSGSVEIQRHTTWGSTDATTYVVSDARGQATLSAGTVTISTKAIRSSSIVLLTPTTTGTLTGFLQVGAITAGTSFVVSSTVNTDTSKFNWLILDPI